MFIRQQCVSCAAVTGKRKAVSEAEICPSKKPKTINDGFCVFIGNLNKTKNYEQVKMSLANYLMNQSLLVQDIRLHPNRSFAYVDLASEVDLTKALTLNGKKVLDLPLRISKAKVKVNEDKKKKKRVKPTPEEKAAKFSKWLSVTNLPHNSTKADIMGIFKTAVDVQFPGGTTGPSSGIAIVHFETKEKAEKAMKKKRGKKLRDRVIKINTYRSKRDASVDGENTPAIAPETPTNTLIIKNLPRLESEVKLKKIFKKAVGINVAKDGNNARGFAFVDFKTVKDAKEAMEMAQGMKILKKAIQVDYCKTKFRPVTNEVLLTTLIVTGLDEITTQETLKTAFEGCTSARIIRDKKTAKSKGFGFVDFAQQEACRAAKESMEDCEIDGKKVNLAYAKPQVLPPKPTPKKQCKQQHTAQPGDQPEDKPETQLGDEPKPEPKDQPSGDKSTQSKRHRIRKKAKAKDGAKDGPENGAKDGVENGAEDGAKDGVENGAEDGVENGAEDGAENGAEDVAKEAEVKE
ncbi:nucleolin [Merluccius polli]|uniref:Nucleolin n=1 Tax=Merluccius polli TaxID=89951 RepID=A0AA47NVN3_MERPO|nr:nucleolin [Merluccius polli]